MRVAHAVERAADDLPPRFEQIPKQVRELLEQDPPLTVAKRQLRLRDARTTSRKYGHAVGNAQRRAMEMLPGND